MFKKNYIPILILIIITAFFICPQTVYNGAINGITLWYSKILPFLFPMFILSNILLQYNFLYSVLENSSILTKKLSLSNLTFIPFFISIVAGYPSGALAVNLMSKNNKVSTTEANYLTTFTNNCSYQFISSVIVFSMLNDFSLLKYIALPHYFGALLLGILSKKEDFRDYKHSKGIVSNNTLTFDKIFSNSIYKSIKSILTVGGVIIIFSIFSEFINFLILSRINPLFLNSKTHEIISSLIVGIFEITNGCNMICTSSVPVQIKLLIINFLISFSGFCIIFQTIAVTNDFNFDLGKYIKYRFLLGLISIIICLFCLILFPI